MSTYSTNLALELIGTGEQAGTWGNTTNTNLGTLIEQAISGYVTQAVSTGADTTITIPNGASGVARNMYIELTGTGGASTNLVVPANKKLYFIFNNASGAVTVKVSGQTGVSVGAGEKVVLVSNGTDVVNAVTYLSGASANITVLTAGSATITTLIATSGTVTTLGSTSANITTLSGTSANITTINGTSANITTVTGTTGGFTSANITTLSSTSANITTLTGTSATITTILDGVGNVRNIPSVGAAKTSAYTLAITDIGEFVTVGVGGSITVPNDIFSAGNVLSVFNNTTGNISINCPITTAYIAGTDTDKASLTLSTRGIATILFVNPSLCVATGNLT
jgi:hypothetical protein